MLEKDERRLRRWEKATIGSGLLPAMTLLVDLIAFLNKTKTVHGKKIVTILEMMLELEGMTSLIKPEEPMIAAVEWERTDPKKYEIHWEIEKRTAMLERELSKYRFSPRAEVAMGGGGQRPSEWATWWRGDVGRKPEEHLRMAASHALELILKVTQAGDLTRLRRCILCKKWLYARFRHQVFCSTKCQQESYTLTPEWKERRRRYMRERYAQLFGSPRSKRKTK